MINVIIITIFLQLLANVQKIITIKVIIPVRIGFHSYYNVTIFLVPAQILEIINRSGTN